MSTPTSSPSPLLALNLFLAAVLFYGSVEATSALLAVLWLRPALRLAVLFLPLPFFLLFVVLAVRTFKDYDEQQRRLLTESIIFATVIIFFALLGAELLRAAGVPLWDNRDAWPYLAFAGYLLGYWSAKRRYR
jgi:hypothetical protein